MNELKVETKQVIERPSARSGQGGGQVELIRPTLTNTIKFALLRFPNRFIGGDLIHKPTLQSRVERDLQLRQIETVIERQTREQQQGEMVREARIQVRESRVIRLQQDHSLRLREEVVVGELMKRVKKLIDEAGLSESELRLGVNSPRLLQLLNALTPQEQEVYFKLLGLQLPQGGPNL